MIRNIKILITVLLVIAWWQWFNYCLVLISAPSDTKMYSGIAGMLGSVLVLPWLYQTIWKNKKEKHEEEN